MVALSVQLIRGDPWYQLDVTVCKVKYEYFARIGHLDYSIMYHNRTDEKVECK